MSDTIYIGIDPGTQGGICALGDGVFGLSPLAIPEKLTERDVADFLFAFSNRGHAILERVGANRQAAQGERQQGASSMFTFGQGYGFLRGILIAHGIPFTDVQPRKWQQHFGLTRRSKDESTTEKKNRHKAVAQQLFPQQKITHWKADAILLAEYGRQTMGQVVQGPSRDGVA